MRSWRRRSLAIIVFAVLAAHPTLGAACLAECEPPAASADATSAAHHDMNAGCHQADGSDTRVNGAGASACGGDHDRTMIDPAAAVTPSRDVASHLLAASSATISLAVEPSTLANLRAGHHASALRPWTSTIHLVLRI